MADKQEIKKKAWLAKLFGPTTESGKQGEEAAKVADEIIKVDRAGNIIAPKGKEEK